MKSCCQNCGDTGSLHEHHVIPRILGGVLRVDLCETCHGLIHGLNFSNHGELTKLGLAKAKDRGVKLGTPTNLTKSAQIKGSLAMKTIAREENLQASTMAKDLRKFGFSLRFIAHTLNENGHRTRKGNLWGPVQVSRIINA